MSTLVRTLLQKYEPKVEVKQFLSGFFKTEEGDIFQGRAVEIHVVRDNEEYAVTIKHSAGSRKNQMTKWTGREFEPPSYNESVDITATSLDIVRTGVSKYNMSDMYETVLVDTVMKESDKLLNKILRGIEIMARDILFFGKITLVNGDEIDFQVKADHFYTTPTAWTASTANPFNDFGEIAYRIQRDSGRIAMDAIGGGTAIEKFKNNDIVKDAAKFRQFERMSLESPIRNDEGAVYHGTINAEDYKINIWSFPQSVRVPEGYGLPNEGDKVPYVPADRFSILPTDPNFKLYYAGNPTLKTLSEDLQQSLGMDRGPMMERGKFVKYAVLDEKKESLTIGIKSSPLPVPVDKDQLGVLIVS